MGLALEVEVLKDFSLSSKGMSEDKGGLSITWEWGLETEDKKKQPRVFLC